MYVIAMSARLRMDCSICSLNIKFFSELSHLFLCFLLFGGHGWIIPGFHPRTIMTMLFFGFWHFLNFLIARVHSRNCLHNDRKTKFCARIHRVYYYACCHGFAMAHGSKMRSKKSPYLFNICRRLDFGAYCGGGDCDYFSDCREMWSGIDLCNFFDSTRNYYIYYHHAYWSIVPFDKKINLLRKVFIILKMRQSWYKMA